MTPPKRPRARLGRAGAALSVRRSTALAVELELALGDLGHGVLRRQHLALLGHLHPPGDGARAAGRGSPCSRARRRGRRRRRGRGRTSSAPVLAQHVGERDLRAVGRPARGDVADVLVGVRVADHHLLLVADGAQRRAVDRLGEQRAHRVRRRLAASRRPRTAARSAASRAVAARAREARLLHQQQHLEQVGRAARCRRRRRTGSRPRGRPRARRRACGRSRPPPAWRRRSRRCRRG